MVNQPVIPVVKKQLMGPVGFSNLPNQVHRRSLKRGFFFNLMVVGASPTLIWSNNAIRLTRALHRPSRDFQASLVSASRP